MKLISVVTVVFNDVKNIGKTIESVLSQNVSQSEIEYIVIDGGSTDGTVDVIKKYINNISVFISEKDSGIYNAMNKSLQYITGKWCMFLNSGDTLCRDAFIILKTVSINTNVAIIHGNVIRSFSQGKVREKFSFEEGDFPHVCHQSAIIRTKIMKKFGYDENYHICADLNFFKNVFDANYKFLYVDQDIAIYDMNGYSSYNIIKYAKEKKQIGFKLSPLDMLSFYLKGFLANLCPSLYNYLWYKSEKNKENDKNIFFII